MPSPPDASLSIIRAARCLHYLSHLDSVEGWLSATTGLAILELTSLQESRGIPGNLAEIGVHHGKSCLVLAGAARPGETVFAIDVFERQDLNIDWSGRGDRDIFLKNLACFFPGTPVTIIAQSSSDLRANEAAYGLTNLRFFSIDGGHTRSLTLNDLRVADAALRDEGVCCLDDLLNAHWTGVISGLFDFLGEHPRLVPFAIFPNKLFLCRPGYREIYTNHLRTAFDFALEKRALELHDYHVDIYGERWPHVSGTFSAIVRMLADDEIALSAQRMGKPEHRVGMAEQQVLEAQQTASIAEQRAAKAEERVNQLTQWVDAFQSSTSWRLTAPARAIASLVGRKRGPSAAGRDTNR